jgi:hypothetical protein
MQSGESKRSRLLGQARLCLMNTTHRISNNQINGLDYSEGASTGRWWNRGVNPNLKTCVLYSGTYGIEIS